MDEKEVPVYGCPYCKVDTRGTWKNPKMGIHNLQQHVKSKHHEKYEAFMKTNMDDYEIEPEPPTPTPQETPQPPETPPPTFQPLPPAAPPQRVVIPFQEILDPDVWIANFLKSQASVKDKFINFQTQRVKLTGRLPEPMDLEADLKEMDSGVKNPKEAAYIKFFYEAALEDYLRASEVNQDYGRRGIRMERERSGYHPIGRGIMVDSRREYPYDPPPQRTHAPTSWMEEELMRLREDARRRDEEDRRRQDRENADLKAQLLALQHQLQTGGGGGNTRLEQKLEQMEIDRRRMEEQYAQLKENTLLDRIRQIEAVARSGPSTDEIKTWLKDTVDQYRAQILVEKNIEDLVDKKLQSHSGPTQTQVELERARNDLLLGQKKLDIEEKKASQWGDTLKNVAGVFGEGIGKGMSAGKHPPAEPQTPQQTGTTCPHCSVSLILP